MTGGAYVVLVITVLLPLAAMFYFSFLTVAPISGRTAEFTLKNYADFFTKPLYRINAQRSITLGFYVTLACFILGYPAALAPTDRLARFHRLFEDTVARHEAAEAFIRIRDGVEQYLWVQTVTGLMIAVGSWAAMAAVGLDNAVFWAFLIFIASYIPIIGGAVGILAPPVFALVQFETYWQAVVLIAVLQSIQFVVGNVVLPRMQGESLNIDPVVVLLSLAFWGAVWGVAGMFLSTPLTVIAMVVCAQFDGARWVAVLLSADGEPDKLRNRKIPSAPDEKPASKPAPASRNREIQ